VTVKLESVSHMPFERLEIVANGQVVGEGKSGETLQLEHALPEGGWIAARCLGSAKSMLDLRSPIFAHTSPVFVNTVGRRPCIVPSAVRSLAGDVEQVRLWVERDGRFAQDKSKTHLLEQCDEALRVLAKRLSET
jgi:hypothetical protein